jgi:hypothetical protein
MKHRILVLIVLVSMVFFTTIPASADGPNVIINGTFDTDTDWTKGDSVIIDSGKAVCTGSTGNILSQGAPVEIGKTYKVIFTITVTSGALFVIVGDSAVGTIRDSSGTYEENIVADWTPGFYFIAQNWFTGTIDDVSVVEISDEPPPAFDVINHFSYGDTINIILLSALCGILILGFGTLGILGMTASRK